MLLGRWGLPDHAEIATLPMRRLAGAIAPKGGNRYLIEARWYPIFLLFYTGSIAAMSGSNYQFVTQIFHAAVPNRDGRKNGEILLISVSKAMADIHDAFKLVQGLERRSTPRSDHLYALLEPYVNDNLYLANDYEELFDRAEIFMAIEYIHIEHPEPVGQEEKLWAPIGGFGRKVSPRNPLDRLTAEAITAGKSWEPARAGLFGGSSTRFVELANGMSRMMISQPSW
jgi:hypothetical protein